MCKEESEEKDMAAKHPLQLMMERRRNGEKVGIPSYCSANKYVLMTALERAKKFNQPTLIEATANQVNQFGGYTGMLPVDFKNSVMKMAEELGVSKDLIILAGDHLGPLTWANEPEAEAMAKAEVLVREFVLAGFTKIHLDTSMKLGDDSKEEMLATEVIAKRGVRLYKVCMEAYEEVLKTNSEAMRPVFIIGSEVPIPGGAQEAEEGISVTKVADFRDTVDTYKRVFKEEGVEDAWQDVIAVVVQPGVEFGDAQVFYYDREAAADLTGTLKDYPEIIFEGHSTDYQSKECLKEMVEDGIAILKVGPALTFGLREALFALDHIETALVPEEKRAHFIDTLEEVMLANPKNWQKHYHGTEEEIAFARKYSFSDRARYYMGEEKVQNAIDKLLANLEETGIPMSILHQYLPKQYDKIVAGELENTPVELIKDGVANYMEDYEYAC